MFFADQFKRTSGSHSGIHTIVARKFSLPTERVHQIQALGKDFYISWIRYQTLMV